MSRFKPLVFFAIVAIAALLLVLRKPVSEVVNVGDVAPEFTVPDEHGVDRFVIQDETGKDLKLSELRGNVVFLNFWYTTCVPCRQEMPDMEALTKAFKDRKFKMIPISVDTNFEDVKQFYQDFKLASMPMYLDPGKQIASRYNIYKFPETYIIDGNGVVLKHYIGGKSWMTPQYMSEIEGWIRKEETPTSASQ